MPKERGIVKEPCAVSSGTLYRGRPENLFCKVIENEYCRFCRPQFLCHNYIFVCHCSAKAAIGNI